MDREGMPNSDMEPTRSLDDELAAAGLDSVFWSKVLKDKLGVTDKKQLDYVDEKDLILLKEQTRFRWEEKALRKLFNISESSKSDDQTKTEGKPPTFSNACEHHATKNTVKAKELEAKLKTFHNEPKETHLKNERTLKDCVEGLMKKPFTGSESKFSPAMSISDEEILKTSSGGLALQGIFKTDKVEDLFKDRQQLIKVDACKLAGPRHNSHYRKYEFSCYKSHREFFESVEKLGLSYSAEHDLGFPAMQAKCGLQNASVSSTTASLEDRSEKAYEAATLCHYIPLASTFIDKLILSDSAKKELIEINELLHAINEDENNPRLLQHAEKFFQKFGSHVSQGPIHFGGTFWWKAHAQGFSEQNQKKVKTMVNNVLDMNCSVASKKFLASHHLSVSKEKGASHKTISDELNTVVQFCIDKFGGPSATDDHTLWKRSLAESNKTWAVIDRGSTLTPVWHIIRTQHKDEFQDPFRLCTFLMRAYEKITHQRAKSTDDVTVLQTLDEAKEMMRSVHEWSVSDAENHLRDLLKMKTQIKETTTSFRQWIDVFLSNKTLQKFLTDITQYDDDNLKFMTCLVMDTHCHEVKTFPNRAQILQWMRGKPEFNQNENENDMFCSIHQFYDVQKVLEKSFEDFQQIPEKDKNNTKKITCEVTHAINSWIDTMKGSDYTDLVFLVKTLAKLVGYKEDTFHPILGPQEIEFLKNELSDTHRKYMGFRKQSTLKAQAFSLLTALTATYESHLISVHEKQKLLDAFKHTMKTDIIPNLGKAIDDFSCHVNLEEFEQTLRLMIAEPSKLEDSSQSTDKKPFSENKETTDNSEVQHGFESKNAEGFFQHNIGLASPYAEMFKKLDLLKYYPAKISNADINDININASMCNNQVGKDSELWFHFIYKLLTLDVNVRFLCIEPELDLSCEPQSNTLESFINFQDDSAVSDIKQETYIHPMDICMAVFYCSNDFVRQIVFTQLFKCHFALPLLVPQLCNQEIEMPVWPLQMSALTWHSTDRSAVTSSILDMSLPVVSFMRLGSSRISKSNIMNDIINKNRHKTFFSRHCKGSTTTRLLLDGLAEISWYLPEEKINDIFQNCVAFINLHGDACKHPKQVEFLKGLSSVIVLLLPENLNNASVKASLDGFLKCGTPIVALFSGIETINKRDPQKIAAKNGNEAELTKEIIFKCNQYLSQVNMKQKLKDHFDNAKQQGFIVGTEIEKLGRNKAEMLMNILYGKEEKMPPKNEHLPLQGQMWKDWCNKDKEFHRPQCKEQKSIEQHRAEITQDKQKIRKDQQKKASPNIFMEDFLQYAVKAEEKERLYFFNWFRRCLENATTCKLVDLKKQYNTAWLKYRESSEEDKGNLKTNLRKISDRIKQSTFGIQHVFREIGQLYESHHSFSKTIHGIELDHLPEIAVDWMLSGHPLELMVGDTNYVPIKWFRAVIKKLDDKIGDKRVLVLSVVGLQSSGKSTLLNTMFGLNFAVSSGPCTRGAFMHLLPVKEQMRNQLYDYILVMDTEGLRSTETDPDTVVKNDNELATLIIGISDIALINVMGENLCEIQNILQVCFQALLRMKLVNIKPSCIFVHQNVSDMAAMENNQEGRTQLIDKLDEISRAAAEEENQVVSGFTDIINFDVNRDVFYFKSLLEGDPPMAPPNPSYSQNVQELKKRVLSISDWQPNYKPLSLSELSERVKDIWDALLNENFVFNFRNSLDMGVYSDLEKEYQSWSWQLRKKALETQKTLNSRIKSGEFNISKSELKDIFADTHNTIKMNVDKYFRTQKHSDILSQWRALIDSRLERLMEELTNETYDKGLKEINQRKLKLELDSKMKQYEKDLFQKSMAAASELRIQTPTDDLIQSEFDKLWIQWTTVLSSLNPEETEIDVLVMVENAVFDRFEKHKNTICNISEKEFKFDHANHFKLSLSKYWKYNQLNELGNDISKQILEDTNKRITQKAAEENEVTENFIHEILGEIDEMIKESQSSYDLHFTGLYKASISAYVCRKVTSKLRKINEDFKSANDPIKQLMNQKQNYFELYRQYCQGAELVKTFVSVLTGKLKEAMQCALYDKYSIDIAEDLKSHHPALKHNKLNLELHIMKQLAEKENFKDCMMYIQNPKSFYREFMRECVLNYIDDEAKVVEALKSSWSQLTHIVLVESSSASENMRETQGNASMWLDQFCAGLYRTDLHINLLREDLRSIENMDIDAQILQESVACSLKEMVEETLKVPKSIMGSQPLIFKLKEKPIDILYEQLSGCCEQCPFCKAVCTNTIPNHTTDHTVEWHRSQAIGGLFYDHWSLRLWKLWYRDEDAGKYFVMDMCSTSVISDNKFKAEDKWIPFKDYKNAGHPYNTWKIPADNNDRLYWKRFICTFQKQLEEQYHFKFVGRGKIPESWKNITKDQVRNELDFIINENEINRIQRNK